MKWLRCIKLFELSIVGKIFLTFYRVVAADSVGRGVHVRPPGDELHVVQADGADVRGQLLQCVDIARYCVDIARYSW